MKAQIVVTAVGLWLMAAPAVLGYGDPAAANHRIAGPVIAAAGFLAIFAITRGVRWFNLLPAGWLLLSLFLLDSPSAAMVNSICCGVVVLVLAPVGHTDQSRYGGGWLSLWQEREASSPDGLSNT